MKGDDNMGFKDKLSKTLNTAAEKSTELAGKAKTKVDISSKKGSITTKYKEIGTLIYEGRINEEDVTEDVEALCLEIDNFKTEIEELESQS